MHLPEDRIMLARRDTGWIESDPREIENWFIGAVREHGKVLRRVCRYLKGWRDFQWRKGGPSSITLMACVVDVFDDLNGTLPENRDDLALQAVADRLDALFSRPILNPVLPDQNLDEGWSSEERLDFKTRAADLKMMIDGLLNKTLHKRIALTRLQEKFGGRIPDDELLIHIDTEEREVLAHAPVVVAAPFVPRTTSGWTDEDQRAQNLFRTLAHEGFKRDRSETRAYRYTGRLMAAGREILRQYHVRGSRIHSPSGADPSQTSRGSLRTSSPISVRRARYASREMRTLSWTVTTLPAPL